MQEPTSQTNNAIEMISNLQLVGPPVIQKFNGDSSEWILFVQAFEEIFAKRISTKSLKLQKLIQYSSPKVREKIEMFNHDVERGYERAMKLLWDLYGHPSTVVKHIVDGLVIVKQQIKVRDQEGLLLFSHQLACAIELVGMIQNLHVKDFRYDYMAYLDNPDILVKLLKRIPERMAADFIDTLGCRPVSVHELRAFLQKKTESGAQALHVSLNQNQGKPEVKNEPKKKSVFHTTEELGNEHKKKNEEDCPVCEKRHNLNECPKFNEISPYRRRSVLAKSKRCFNCFAVGHFQDKCSENSKCTQKTCMWTGKYDSRVHRNQDEKGEESKKNEQKGEVSKKSENDGRYKQKKEPTFKGSKTEGEN